MRTLRIEGYVTIFQWDSRKYRHPFEVPEKERIYYVRNAKNIITNNLVLAFTAKIINPSVGTIKLTDVDGNTNSLYNNYSWVADGAQSYDGPRLGRDTSTPASHDDYKLADEILVDRDSLLKEYNVSASSAWITWTSTWNAGKITDTVGEVGLFGHAVLVRPDGTSYTAKVLFARLASADGSFTPFTPDPTYALTVSYKLVFW